MKVSWMMTFPIYGKGKQCSKPTTRFLPTKSPSPSGWSCDWTASPPPPAAAAAPAALPGLGPAWRTWRGAPGPGLVGEIWWETYGNYWKKKGFRFVYVGFMEVYQKRCEVSICNEIVCLTIFDVVELRKNR